MNILSGTKADILNDLQGIVKLARIPESFTITRKKWSNESARNSFIKILPKDTQLIIRSSSKWEDTETSSNAGAYVSIPNVNLDTIEEAVRNVFASYSEHLSEDQVLIQIMIKDLVRSGVAFSHEPTTGSPYKTINWQEGNDSSFVTSGQGGKTWIQTANYRKNIKTPIELKKVIDLINELEQIYIYTPLDIEFAISKENSKETLWLLQVRKLIISRTIDSVENQINRIKIIEKNIEENINSHPFILGEKTIYGIMPDWNPAEIIGVRPRPLALSLYKELVTDRVWAEQRKKYGYRDLTGFPLMKTFLGLPYIDLRISFNSFIPENISTKLASKLIDFYIKELSLKPHLHDKIEFDIAFTCYHFDLEKRIEKLKKFGFSNSDLADLSDSLHKQTSKIININNGIWLDDIKLIKQLEKRRKQIFESDLNDKEKLCCLIEDIKKYGTLPFAGLARTAFIAVSLLKSLVEKNIFTENDYNCILRSIDTVSSNLSKDKAKLNKKEFLNKYGHLRPGTYDIMSPRYDEDPDLYFEWDKKNIFKNTEKINLSKSKLEQLDKELEKHNLEFNSKQFLYFITEAIKQRELSKFIFSKNLSDVLKIINNLGSKYGLTSDDLSFSNIDIFMSFSSNAYNVSNLIQESIRKGRDLYKEASYICLPPLIFNKNDPWGFSLPETSPNFITQNNITAPVRLLQKNSEYIDNHIICIPFADPGYDWIFSYNISGLITCYGGINSHMSIRAGEMGLPAVIGCGETKFKKWSNAKILRIDCNNKEVLIIS